MTITVPRVSSGQVDPIAMPGVRVRGGSGGFDNGIGPGVAQLARIGGEIFQREQEKADAAVLNQARVQLADHERQWFDPSNQSGVYSYQGQNGLQVPKLVNDDLTSYSQQLRQTMTPSQQQGFDRIYADHRNQILDRANSYALGQKNEFERQAFEGAVGSAASAATTKAAAGDINGAELARADGINSIAQHAAAQGWDEDYARFTIDKFNKGIDAAVQKANVDNVQALILQDPTGALADLSARLKLGQYATPGVTAGGDANAPRGVRNNNPGNLIQTDVQWEGKTASADPQYESFATPEHGIRALALNAQHMQGQGAQSVSDLITKWAPPNENNTAAYINAVAKQMGVDPNGNIDLQDPATLTAFTQAVVDHENGPGHYTPQQVQTGVEAALGKTKLSNPHPAVAVNGSGIVVPGDQPHDGTLGKSGNPAVDALDTGQIVELYNRARAETNRRQVEGRGLLEQRVRDDSAAFSVGKSVAQPLTLGEFTGAYGDREGMQRYGAYQAQMQLGQDLQTVQTLTPEQMQELAQARAPQPGENFAVKQQAQNSLISAMDQTIKARAADPVLWAQTVGIGGFQNLDTSSPDKIANSIASRVGPATTISQAYQAPYRLLTKPEATALSSYLNDQPATVKAETMGKLANALQPADYAQIVSIVKPNSPTTAIAGQIMGAQRAAQVGSKGALWWKAPVDMDATTIAQTMLTGEALLNPTKADKDANGAPKFAMPSDGGANGLRSVWSAQVGDAFRGDPDGDVQSFQAFRAMYAGLAAKKGISDGALDDNLAITAARATVGAVTDWNGKVVIPPYGMDGNTFKDAAADAWSQVKATVPDAFDVDVDSYDLDRIGDGVYAVSNGQAPIRDENGRPVVLRISPTWQKPAEPSQQDGRKARNEGLLIGGPKLSFGPSDLSGQASTPATVVNQ
ncbi:hypothetical protein ACQKIE_16035 [Luteibacter sp. NPDC031894]|uniref:hypothetical protein n=1 Tax=Luteibacter sp. NPDC031894 TaxID=3390572 RepID=UPI003CFCEF78